MKIAIDTSNTSLFHEDYRAIFHALRRHVALDPAPISSEDQVRLHENEAAWSRMLVDRIMPLLLPPEDLENPCLQVLVSDIFAEMIVRNGICGKACENWLIWEGLTKIIHVLRPETAPQLETTQDASPISRLEQFGLLATNISTSPNEKQQFNGAVNALFSMAWMLLQYAALTFSVARSVILSLMHASSLPSRNSNCTDIVTPMSSKMENNGKASPDDGSIATRSQQESSRPRPIIAMSIWSCVSLVLSLRQRMPWLSGFLSLLQWLSLHRIGQVCRVNGALDR